MDVATRREIRRLKVCLLVTTTLLGAITLAAFRESTRQGRFIEIDVERLNIVEPDGTLRLTMSNRARLPDPVIGGRPYPLRGDDGRAGLLFYNDEGNEAGGLLYAGADGGAGRYASAALSFDAFDQDEAVTIVYAEERGRRGAGLAFTDRPAVPIQPFADTLMALRDLPQGVERDRRIDRFRVAAAERGDLGARRLFLRTDAEGGAILALADLDGRARLRLYVDEAGAASLEFLDGAGQVTRRLPAPP